MLKHAERQTSPEEDDHRSSLRPWLAKALKWFEQADREASNAGLGTLDPVGELVWDVVPRVNLCDPMAGVARSTRI